MSFVLKSILRKILFSVLLVLIVMFPILSYGFNPYTDIAIDYLPDIDYHPAVVLGEMVIIRNQDAYASPLLHDAASRLLDRPLGMYINGVQARRLHRYDGSGEDGYVEIAIEGNGLDAGFSGYIDERHLVSPSAKTPVLPTVMLNAQEGDISLYSDYSEDSPVIATYASGTQAQLLGLLIDMCHIKIGDHSGFVKSSQLQLPHALEQDLIDTMPKQFMRLSANHKHLMEIVIALEMDIIKQYGGDWPLLQKAEYADICMSLGFPAPFLYGVYIMPNSDDLPQQEAIAIAAQDVSDRLGIAQDVLLEQYEVSVSFFDATYKHTGHHWRIVFSDPAGIERRDTEAYISSPSGEVIDF